MLNKEGSMINENETINLSQFSVRETKGFWGRSLDLEKKAEIANEKVARASSSIFFGVRHYTKEKKIRVNVSGFCKIGSVLYGANFDKDFTTEKQKVLATHILLDCLHGNVTQINKQALKNFVLPLIPMSSAPFFSPAETSVPWRCMAL